MNPTRRTPTMTSDQLTTILAERVMHWRVGPDRFLTGKRRWIPRWRFNPLTDFEDAFRLLNVAAASLALTITRDGSCTAEVKVEARAGRASYTSVATSITVAIARAVGLEIPDGLVRSPVATLQMKGERRKR